VTALRPAAPDSGGPGQGKAPALVAPFGQLGSADPLLASRLGSFGPPPAFRRPAGFATLVRIVLEQSVSLASAAAVHRRLEARTALTPECLSGVRPEALRAVGLTAGKARAIAALARHVRDGSFDLEGLERLDDAQALSALEARTGIGPWTSAVYLMTALGRPDVWPEGDRALQLELARDGVQGRGPCRERAARWRPHRSAAARLLWHAHLCRQQAGRPRARSRRRPSA